MHKRYRIKKQTTKIVYLQVLQSVPCVNKLTPLRVWHACVYFSNVQRDQI
jgi:hypothetical protein